AVRYSRRRVGVPMRDRPSPRPSAAIARTALPGRLTPRLSSGGPASRSRTSAGIPRRCNAWASVMPAIPPPTTSTSSTALYCTTMSRGLRGANEALAFLLEIAALVAVGVWGYHVGSGVPVKVALAIAVPVLVAVVWGLFAAPRAVVKLPLWGVLVVKALVFGAAALALYA